MILYTSPTCHNCDSVKNLLKEKNVFEECEIRDVSNIENKRELMKLGYMGVPLLLIGGKEISGFKKDEVELAIKEEFNV